MEVVGKTQDGKLVVSGLGKLYFQNGLPLSFIFDKCIEQNFIPSWNLLYQEMEGNGMKHDRIIHLLNEQVFESYGKDFRDHVIKECEKMVHGQVVTEPS